MRLQYLLTFVFLSSGCAAKGVTKQSSVTDPTKAAAHAVVATVQELFDSLRDRDVAAAASLLAADARFIAIDAAGVHSSTRESFLERLPTMTGSVQERMWNPEVRIDGNLATLWAPYEFLEEGVRVHCGFDAIQLVHLEGRWRVLGIAFTSRKDSCPKSSDE